MSPNSRGRFPASYDSTTKVITGGIVLLLVGVFIATRSVAPVALGALVLLGSYAWSPRGYTIDGRTIVVHRVAGTARFPLDEIREARPAARDDFNGCLRLFGNGGVFGYYGLFRTAKLGRSTWYVTNRGNCVVVATAAKTAVFSPDDVDAFLAAVRAAAPLPQSPSRASSIELTGGTAQTATLIGAAIGLLAIALVSAVVLYSPGPPDYALTTKSLAIRDRFYPVTPQAAAVDLDRVRVVDLTVDTEWRPTARTNGFANSHYHSGWFRLPAGRLVRLYRAAGNRLVLLPPKGEGAPILLETAYPDQFVRTLHQNWDR